MTRDEVAALLAQLKPSETLIVSAHLLGAYRSADAMGFVLDAQARDAAERFGEANNCSFQFVSQAGEGSFTRRASS